MDVEIPAEPKKIAVLLDYYSDHLLELGIKPHASTTSLVDNQFLPYIANKMEGVIPLGASESPNLEALLEAEPDLIIAYEPSHQQIEDSLRKIAPTLLLDGDLMNDWRQLFLELGTVVGKEELAQQKLNEYLLKAEAAKQELDRKVGEEVFVVMRVMPKELRVYGVDDIRIGRIIHQELGLNGLKLADDKAMMPISLEELPNLNPDHIFLMENVEDVAKSRIDELESSAIWNNIKAVQKNQVYIVEQQLWNRGIAPIGSNQIIDQVLEFVK
ncbi:putative siderophore-binding lipoprotein YfiY precursor [compost metagenome]